MRHSTPEEQADYRVMLKRNSIPLGFNIEHLPPHYGSLTTTGSVTTADAYIPPVHTVAGTSTVTMRYDTICDMTDLIRDMRTCIEHMDTPDFHWDGCQGCKLYGSDACDFEKRMKDLGIEEEP